MTDFFRDEEKEISEATIPPHDYYAQFIAPYKGALEMWYQNNKSFYTDFMLIFLTAWAIIVPESDLVYKVFSDLPVRQNVEIQAV